MKKTLTLTIALALSVFLFSGVSFAYTLTDSNYNWKGSVDIDYDYRDTSGNYSYSAGTFSTTFVDDNDAALLNADGGEWFTAFCVEPGQYAATGSHISSDVELVNPSLVGGGLEAAWLYENYYVSDNSEALTALQLAIWEVMVDDGEAYDLNSGNLTVNSARGDAKNLATTYLAALTSDFDATGLDDLYRISQNPTKQDFIVNIPSTNFGGGDAAATPEPGTIVLLSLGVLGLVGVGRKKFQS